MYIQREIIDYIITKEDSILEALNKINKNKSRIVFVTENNGVLIGSLSDGDLRRFHIKSGEINNSILINDAMNVNYTKCSIHDSISDIKKTFNSKLEVIPLVDGKQRLVAIAKNINNLIVVGNKVIGDNEKTFIIAEIGNNHQGSYDMAIELIDKAVNARADCVKFQMRHMNSLYFNRNLINDNSLDLGTQYTTDLLFKYQLKSDKLLKLFDYCKKKNIIPLCTPWDLRSAEVLNEYGIDGFKVASADLTNYKLLEYLAKTGKPIFCSTGMSTEIEIKSTISFLNSIGANYALLHCNSTYPTPLKDVNLTYLNRLKEISNKIIGYSGHERGFIVPIAAVAMGAKIIEKHFTLDKNLEGNDHKVSLLPNEFAKMVENIRHVEVALGNDSERQISQGEMINRENLSKSLVINQKLSEGEIIQNHMIEISSPGHGLQPNRLKELIGKRALRNFESGDIFFESDLNFGVIRKNQYIFSRPFGIPVRYHDFKKLIEGINLDFVEFHLSFKDIDVKLENYFSEKIKLKFSVHIPELFSNDHLIDLASDDINYRKRSIFELNRTVQVAKNLKNYFDTSNTNPVLILNAGGWTKNGFMEKSKKDIYYNRIIESLSYINLDGISLAIQTMPPFPWHFGGQSHHNLFVDPDEILKFCLSSNFKICLDISHSKMACNFYGWNFDLFLQKILPHTIHLHISDSIGIDGEGVEIGKGDIDFIQLRDQLNKYAPNIQFIPEIWQGHKNNGEGFWNALSFLERYQF